MHVDIKKQSTLLPACHGAWIPAGCRHRLRANLENITLRTIYFHAEENDPKLFNDVHVFGVDQLGKDLIAYCERWADHTRTTPLEKSLLSTIREFVPYWCANSVPLSLPAVTHERLIPIIKYIHEHLPESLTIEDVASVFAMSKRTLIRLFSANVGIKFALYKKIARIIRATELLTHGEKSITRIMYEVGYASQGSFSNSFHEMLGCTPSQYRSLAKDSREHGNPP